ncbi:Two component system histidine kinase [Vibrio anguillarum 775]|uniref:ATP-binding protein n=1 Tax=Vibrio anguillarum TaxID=55601 RepID=UPI000210ECB9|nr:sensor histidine kinase [Vibrio anguillarum]AEH32999.1 Two component system histidine kinase [Vibrio anguillarum 775]AGU57527.1 histidine kinase [Vibrio anguillarum M3]ATA49307.1 sensor histidine kinase [Vibrio anguillarum]
MVWSSISFRKRMLIIMTLSGLIELLLLVAAGFVYIKHSQEEEMGLKALGVASFLAQTPSVVDMLESGSGVDHQQRYRELTKLIGATFIVIGDQHGIRLVHPVDERIGLPMKGGDNDQALLHGESYVSFAQGSLGKSVRGKSAVKNAQGQIVGVVSVGYLIERLQDKIEPFLIYLIGMALLVVLANAVLSSYASRRFQKAILGFEPEEIGRLYVELDVTLFLPESDLMSVIESGTPDHDIELYLNQQRLIANRSPIIVDGKVVGAVSSFRLRDEINELTEQLSQTKEYAEMLRSQTHEHRNKLNTISGLVQMGELEAVQHLIGQETAHYQSLIEFLRETVRDPLIAGMLLGKTERARELGLELVVEEGSRLEPLPQRINAEDIVTILGNLIDNAFDATLTMIRNEKRVTQERRIIEVSLSDYGAEIILEVDDKGCGLPEQMSPQQLWQKGVSSKAKHNRGVGLHLVKQLADRYQGQLEMKSNQDVGTRVTVYLPKEEQV